MEDFTRARSKIIKGFTECYIFLITNYETNS